MNKIKIMFVDDEIELLDIFEMFLSGTYDVITAENGCKAMELFLLENPPVIITDVDMPCMTGMELLKNVKEISPSTEIILMTGHPSLEISTEALKSGAVDCLSKPLSLSSLKGLIEDITEKKSQLCFC